MNATKIILGRTEISKGWRIGLFSVMGLMAAISLAILIGGPLFAPRHVAYAAPMRGNEPWLKIKCVETLVEEGEDFRLEVRKKFDSDSPHPTMRVFWYTDAITADETDYEHLYAERQSSNGSQSESGVMGRNFHTLDDQYPEIDETFKVQFNNSVDYGHDGECIITIADDDGVGIYDLAITSEPGEITTASGDEVVAYGAGDVIEISAHFTGTVTTLNPDTGERADYAGLYIQVGENRRVATLLSGDGSDNLVFGYTVTEDDVDADGISVEGGGPGTGMYYNVNNRNGGLWAARAPGGRINRIFHGLDDDSDHVVVLVSPKEDEEVPAVPPDNTITPPDPTPEPEPEPELWVARSESIEPGLIGIINGELTEEAGGRDWYSFEGEHGENYIIELKNQMEFHEGTNTWIGGHLNYVDGHLIDPSILEVVDEDGEQVLGEQDEGGFMANFARAFFTPDEDGTYYIAIGGGREQRGGLGFYELSVRVDDYADDYGTDPDVALRPGEFLIARIDSDVAPGDAGLKPWHWVIDDPSIPVFGLESPDDRDVFEFRISEEGTYEVSVFDGPPGVGIWNIWNGTNGVFEHFESGPVESAVLSYSPGTYYVEVGNVYESKGNTGSYTVSLLQE